MLFAALAFQAQTRNPGGVSVVIPGTDPESRGCCDILDSRLWGNDTEGTAGLATRGTKIVGLKGLCVFLVHAICCVVIPGTDLESRRR